MFDEFAKKLHRNRVNAQKAAQIKTLLDKTPEDQRIDLKSVLNGKSDVRDHPSLAGTSCTLRIHFRNASDRPEKMDICLTVAQIPKAATFLKANYSHEFWPIFEMAATPASRTDNKPIAYIPIRLPGDNATVICVH